MKDNEPPSPARSSDRPGSAIIIVIGVVAVSAMLFGFLIGLLF